MDIRSGLEGLMSIFGANQTPPPAPSTKAGTETHPPAPLTKAGTQAASTALTSDRATLSSAGSGGAQASSDSDVRWDKVASVQTQLAAGTYNVPASAVAGKLVSALLAGDR